MGTVEEKNKEVVKAFMEAMNSIQGDIEKIPAIVDKYISPEFVNHTQQGDGSFDSTVRFYQMGYTGYPDMKTEIQDIIAEGDKVVVRATTTGTHTGYLGDNPPTGNKINVTPIAIFRVDNGKIQEEWHSEGLQ